MAFSEALKIKVRKHTHFSCCLCHVIDVEVHHIIPEAEGGPDTEDNAAPLCASCHNVYGANPQKRKFIREARDHWYEVCRNRFQSDPDGLEEIKRLLRDVARPSEPGDLRSEALNRYPDQPSEGASVNGELHFELRGDPRELGAEIWIWQKAREKAVKLCDTAAWGNLRVFFSPDDRHIVVRDGGSSMGIDLRLFSRESTNATDEFKELENTSIGDNVERFALAHAGLGTDLVLHHRYMGCLWWSDDSKSILIHLTGSGNREKKAYHLDWIGTYNVLNGEVSMDLASMNANAVTVWNGEQPNEP
ncbi:MAG TPA: HNH endonuclease [Candidatus Udaeobacter sp.]|jgi:hypothetical protein